MNASAYIQKLKIAQEIVDKHNENLETSDRLQWDDILKLIKKMGGTTEDSLGEMTWEDIQDCGVPRLLSRSIAKVFREKETQIPPIVTKEILSQMTVAEILEYYDPNDERNIVTKALKKAANSEVNFIVFNENGKVDVAGSKKLWDIYRETEMHSPMSNLGGTPRTVYKIGETLPKLLDENPILEGRPLIDGCCYKSGVRWDDIPLEIKQFVRVIHEFMDDYPTNEIVAKILDFHEMLCKTSTNGTWKGTMEKLAKRYPNAWLSYQNMQDEKILPDLKIRTGKKLKKSNNPFGTHQEY